MEGGTYSTMCITLFNCCIIVWTEDCCIAHTFMDKVRHMYVCWMVDKKALHTVGVFLDREVMMKECQR